jgi:predicted helicase
LAFGERIRKRQNLRPYQIHYLTDYITAPNEIGGIAGAEALFHHAVAAMHSPAYREENAGALRQDWPRVPLPATRDGLEAGGPGAAAGGAAGQQY